MTVLTAVAAAWLAALTVVLPAEPIDPLRAAAVRLGAARMTVLRVTGFGTAYLDSAGRLDGRADATRHAVARYAAAYDYRGRRAAARVTPVAPAPRGVIDPGPDLLASPHGFVSHARAVGAAQRPGAHGVEVAFEAGSRRYVGLLTPDGDVDRVRVSARRGTGRDWTEIRYRDYETTADGVRFPRHLVEARGGRTVLDVWVSGVEAAWDAPRTLASLRAEDAAARAAREARGSRRARAGHERGNGRP